MVSCKSKLYLTNFKFFIVKRNIIYWLSILPPDPKKTLQQTYIVQSQNILKATDGHKGKTCRRPIGFATKPIITFRSKDFCFVQHK